MNRTVFLLLGGLVAVVLIAAYFWPAVNGPVDAGTMQTSRIVYLVAAALYVGAASWAAIRGNPGRMAGHLLIWVGIIALLTAIISFFG